jgi:GNAT superfamily N-acetyltransferase
MSGLTIQELTIPASVDDADASDFVEMTRVRNEIEAATVGSFDLAYTSRELLPAWQDPDQPKRLFVAKVDGRIVGRAVHEAQLGTDVKSAWLEVEVASAHRRRGIGGALYDTVAAVAAHEGRTILQAFTLHPNRVRVGAARGRRRPLPARARVSPRAGRTDEPPHAADRRGRLSTATGVLAGVLGGPDARAPPRRPRRAERGHEHRPPAGRHGLAAGGVG